MAAAVEDAVTHGGTLVVESGTGTGKTYAYLVPIILSGKRTIISTGTKHLQDQIFNRDLPQVGKIIGRPVNAVLLKGRANYLCHYRLNLHTQQSDLIGETETTAESHAFQIIQKWAARTRSGDISEVVDINEASPVWRQVTSTADNCLGGQCPDFKRCCVMNARQQAMKSDIVVVNHHLFFSNFALQSEGGSELLPQHDAVIFDEAHSIAEIAADFFGFLISTGQIIDLENDIQSAEQDEKSGVVFSKATSALAKAMKQLQSASKSFVDQSVDFERLQNDAFAQACLALTQALEILEKALAAAAPAGDALKRCHARCLLIQSQLDAWLNGRDSNLIRWAQVGMRSFRFHATPLSISDRFAKMMKKNRAAWVFTSATLAVGDDFSAFCERLGLHNAETRRWESPYNFAQNSLLYLPPDMPEPREVGYDDALSEVIAQVLHASRGRAFCLFTSYEMMNRVYKRLRDNPDWSILLQGQAPKNELLKRFSDVASSATHSAKPLVLFGTASFWEGVDVVGERLSCVIIDKLPFASPSDPVLKNRLNACEQDGGNPFMSIQIPAAVIALKQGVGRLIRSETDRGVLVLCDPRLVSKRYGNLFLKSLPTMPRSKTFAHVRAFFAHDEDA